MSQTSAWIPPTVPPAAVPGLSSPPTVGSDSKDADNNRPAVKSWRLDTAAATPSIQTWDEDQADVHVVSLKPRAPKVKCFRYDFCPADARVFAPAPPDEQDEDAPKGPEIKLVPKGDGTRIKPPNDVVKLQDRLFYLLQPPLETLLGSQSLTLPFQPFPYQLEGISFLYARHAAVLADEMGLGKTMQSVTGMRLLLHSHEVRRIILVCPKPLITNWQREFALWAKEVPVTVISGTTEQRRWAWQRDEFPIKIANYETILRDENLIKEGVISTDLLVLDEAQRVKNSSGTTSQAVKSIPRQRSWALTGTPIENSTNDLVGLFDFLSPGMLSRDMRPRSLSEATQDYIMRRTKEQVMTDMPPKLFRDEALALSPDQQASYNMAEGEGVVQLEGLGESITIQHVFELVLRLKQICNFDPVTGSSSKLERLEADLEEVAQSGKKAIVFSQWVDTLERLGEKLKRFNPLQYHGRETPAAREQAMKDFRETDDHTVMLLSYGAGSVGLNLQFTSYVFLYDRWWNPAIEDQAINRAHRIGSSGPVTVMRFVTPGTIEERIDNILREKRELMSMILDNQDGPRQLGLSQEEIFGLFDLQVKQPE